MSSSEYLVKEKYAARGKIALNGGSNGGLLVAACVNRAPEGLLGAAVSEVGVHDLLKVTTYFILASYHLSDLVVAKLLIHLLCSVCRLHDRSSMGIRLR